MGYHTKHWMLSGLTGHIPLEQKEQPKKSRQCVYLDFCTPKLLAEERAIQLPHHPSRLDHPFHKHELVLVWDPPPSAGTAAAQLWPRPGQGAMPAPSSCHGHRNHALGSCTGPQRCSGLWVCVAQVRVTTHSRGFCAWPSLLGLGLHFLGLALHLAFSYAALPWRLCLRRPQLSNIHFMYTCNFFKI